MFNGWFKLGKGGSYNGYIKPRNPINRVSAKQSAQRAKFRSAALACRGKGRAEFRQCMSEHL